MTKENTVNKKETYIVSRTRKATFVKLHLLQFAGAILVAIAIIVAAIIIFNQKEPQVQTVEKEVVKEVTKEVPVTEYVETPVEVEKVVEVEKPVEVIKYQSVEVPVEKLVEVEKIVTVVDEEKVNELAIQLFTVYRDAYKAEVDQEATEAAITEQYEALKAEYIAQADNAETARLAEIQAQELLNEYKIQYAAEQEAARVANVSTVKVYVYFKNNVRDSFYLELQGSLYDRITYDIIYAALLETGYIGEFKVDRIENKDAVEVFVGEDYQSTRSIRLVYA